MIQPGSIIDRVLFTLLNSDLPPEAALSAVQRFGVLDACNRAIRAAVERPAPGQAVFVGAGCAEAVAEGMSA